MLADIFEHNDVIPSHGTGSFILVLDDGSLALDKVERKRIVPITNEKRTIFIENRNLHRLPQVCRGVLISVVFEGHHNIASICCLTSNKFSVYLWKKRMLYCNRLNCWCPDFCLVTYNQIRCFNNYETILDINNCDILFLNQISGYKNNTILMSNYSIDLVDGCYQASPDGPDILSVVLSNKIQFISGNKNITPIVPVSSLCLNRNYCRKHRIKGRNHSLLYSLIPKYTLNFKKPSIRILCDGLAKLKMSNLVGKYFIPYIGVMGKFAVINQKDLKI